MDSLEPETPRFAVPPRIKSRRSISGRTFLQKYFKFAILALMPRPSALPTDSEFVGQIPLLPGTLS